MGGFDNITIGNVSTTAVVIISTLTLIRSKRKDRDILLTSQAKQHEENKQRLEVLMGFKESQEELNKKRDEQISTLTTLASTTASSLKAITEGLDRRVEMMEDIVHHRKGA